MKKTILATVLVALSLASFAGGRDDKKLLADLQTTLKGSQVQWTNRNDYTQATFSFNGKAVSVFYDQSDNRLIGFSIPFAQADLPKEVTDAISKKYSDWSIKDAILFIDANANSNYFAQVQKGKANIALKIINGKAVIYSKMPSL